MTKKLILLALGTLCFNTLASANAFITSASCTLATGHEDGTLHRTHPSRLPHVPRAGSGFSSDGYSNQQHCFSISGTIAVCDNNSYRCTYTCSGNWSWRGNEPQGHNQTALAECG